MDHLKKLVPKELEITLSNLHFEKNRLCDECQKGKQVKGTFKSKNIISTNNSLQLAYGSFCLIHNHEF